MFRTVGDQPSLFESVLPPELLGLPAELARVDELLDDPAAVVADTGEVYSLGTSLNGVGGRTTTAFVPQPGDAVEVLTKRYNELWREATVVGLERTRYRR